MSYRIKLNCADRVRFSEVASKLGIDGEELVKVLLHDFFSRKGVKNPSKESKNTRKFQHTQRV